MKTYVATKNAEKLSELRTLFAGSDLDLATFAAYEDVVEGQAGYADNALLKVRALRLQLRGAGISAAVLADDSGIEVDALAGRPGVLSARYAGESTPWPGRLGALLAELEGLPEDRRGARFVCVVAFSDPAGEETLATGTVTGSIARAPKGHNGFGYDPIFVDARDGRTFGQLSAQEKNLISHRRRAADALLARLRELHA
ncbi:MAG: non-canonical purine NTP pyrophosphatase [Vulcanimicrobiaceae bacterium]